MKELIFVSGNQYKIEEVKKQCELYGVKIIPKKIKIQELQEASPKELIRDKVLKCFEKIKYEFIIEHTELIIDKLNGFPGVHTSPFWETLGAEKICSSCSGSLAKARTFIGYCDGRQIKLYLGEVLGEIASEPKGNRDFQWDCIFIPKGSNKTFSQLGIDKEKYSMRKIAIEKFMKEYNGTT